MSVRIIHGDCRLILPTLPADSFDCCVTSPPYFGLRDYGVEGQIGLEPTLALYLETMVDVCRELRRVLKPSGTFWLNIGDGFSGGGRTSRDTTSLNKGNHVGNRFRPGNPDKNGGASNRDGIGRVAGFKPKDLMMVPNRLAILLQDDGWYVRSEIIWHKLNPMPESVTDRPTCAHEKVWLLTKSERYFYDAEAIAETSSTFHRQPSGRQQPPKQLRALKESGHHGKGGDLSVNYERETRNSRNVWSMASGETYRGAHFAVMNPALGERCIKAGCPIGGSVLDPFGGAGTTGLVADRLGHDATLIELNPANRELGAERVRMDGPLFAEVSA